MKAIYSAWAIIKRAFSDFINDDAVTQAAAVAFYTALSFAPLMVLTITVFGFMGDDAQAKVVDQVQSVIGPSAAGAVDTVIQNAQDQPSLGSIAGIIGVVTILFSATGVFAQLQAALNHIWNVKAKPDAGIWNWVRKRILTLGMLIIILFLLLVSLGVSAALSLILNGDGWIWQLITIVISVAVFTLLFALMFKVLPDVDIAWRDVWLGAAITALLFALGKFVIGLYLGNSSVGSSYGAAGSIIVFLIWVYYSSIILFFGAELTQAYAVEHGSRFQPEEHAMWEDEPKRGAAPAH